MLAMFNRVKRQTAEDCARNLVLAIETAKNGAVLMLELGESQELDMPVMWKPQIEN